MNQSQKKHSRGSTALDKNAKKKAPPSQVRIIGGLWRGQKLNFIPVEGLRPTGDRIRETLFNWLAPVIDGAHCLDLFTGSGALGFEALSRGASSVTMIEKDTAAIHQLQQNQTRLNAEQANIVNADALEWLKTTSLGKAVHKPFDVVFLDPPFANELLQPCCDLLNTPTLVAQGAYVYLEADHQQPLPITPPNWFPLKEKKAGQVSYRLFRVD